MKRRQLVKIFEFEFLEQRPKSLSIERQSNGKLGELARVSGREREKKVKKKYHDKSSSEFDYQSNGDRKNYCSLTSRRLRFSSFSSQLRWENYERVDVCTRSKKGQLIETNWTRKVAPRMTSHGISCCSHKLTIGAHITFHQLINSIYNIK